MPHQDPTPTAIRRQRWTLLTAELTADLATVLSIAARHPGDVILRELARDAGRFSASLKKAMQAPDLDGGRGARNDFGTWGQNGHAPRIRYMAQDARKRGARLDAAVRVERAA